MYKLTPLICLLLIFGITTCFSRTAVTETEKTPLRVPKISANIQIDAQLDEPFWNDALVIEANIEVRPGENIPSPVNTLAHIAYTETHIYVGIECDDPNPDQIRAHFCDRDDLWNDDWILILFDTFNDNQRTYDFFCNPYGIQADEIESTSGGGGSWDAIWESHGRITQDGYVVEMSIPFSSLGFQRSPGDQIWGVDVVRSYPRSVRHHIGSFPRDRNNNCYMCQSLKLIGFDGAKPGKSIEFDPTLSGIHSSEREDGVNTPMELKERKMDPGLTAKWGLTPNMMLSGTVNPDFSQVEADVRQLDINRQYAIWYPEKRPFFLEGADFFSTMLDPVYTRSLADPTAGVKLTGKEGRHTVGFFSVQDDITNFIFPGPEGSDSESLDQRNISSALRYKYDIGKSSNIGLIATDREGDDYYNRVGGVDGILKFTSRDQLRFQVVRSNTKYPETIVNDYEQKSGAFDGFGVGTYVEHNTRNFNLYNTYRQSSPDARADLGFVTQVGTHYVETGGTYKWQRDPGSWFTRIELYGSYDFKRDWEYRPLHKAWTSRLYYEGPLQTYFGIYGEIGRDHYEGDGYRRNWLNAWTGFKPSGLFTFNIWCVYGDQIDYDNNRPGTRFSVSPTLTIKPGVHLYIELEQTRETLDVDPGRLYTANISYGKLVYQFSKRTFVRAIVQYVDYKRNVGLYIDDKDVDSRTKEVFSQFLFSYKLNPQTVLFLGYADNYYGDHIDPVTQTDRTFFVKLGYAWRI